MGDKSIHLSASLGIGRKPKDGKDGTSVTIISNKVYYQVSDSPTVIPQDWKDSITDVKQTDAKPYLWTKTVVVYSNTTKTETYSVSYKGKDGTNGTSFTPKGMADGFFNNMSSVPTYADGMDYDVYVVNVDDRSNPTSELPPYVCRYEYESLVVEHAEFCDSYNVNGHLYVANSNEWVDFGEIQGAKGDPGEKGDDGKDAINIVFSPAELVFDADENGNLKQSEKSAEIKVYRGTTELNYKTDWDNDAEIGDNCRAELLVNTTTNKTEVNISGITSSMIDDVKVPATSGGAKVSVIIDKVTYRAYLPFSVNVNTYANFLIRDNKKYISKYTEISNKYDAVSTELDNKANKNDLKKVESTIQQMPDQIKMEVLSKTSGRRNMLVNSAFRNQDSVFIHSLARIEKNTGVDGVNCIHSSDKYSGDGDGNYIGAFWDSTQKNGVVTNIPIVKGKKYVISCWIKSDNLDLPFNIECLYMKSINQQSRDGAKGAISESFKVHEKNKWEKISCVLDTDNSDATEYLAVNFWSNTKNVPKVTDANGKTDYPTCQAYICKPMMEEGDTYSGWTLSEEDYDYAGGNILDNTRSFEKSGNLEEEESDIINEGYEYAYAVAHSNNTTINHINMLQWNVAGCINDGQDYMFSFLAKGTGVVTAHLWKDGTPSFFIEGSNGKHNDVSNDGFMEFDLTNEWRRYWVHYRMKVSTEHPLPEKLLIRCKSGNDIYVCQPKLEVGATMTEFTERKTDLVDKASLKKAGIEITTDKVKLYGDKVQVLTRKDGDTEYEQAGMFYNGKLNANLIDAINIVTQALQTGIIKAGDAVIENLKVTNADVSGKITATNGTVGNMVINNDSLGKVENNDGVVISKDSIICSRNDLYFTGSNKIVVSTNGDNLVYIQRKQVPILNTYSLSPIVKIASKVGAIGTSAFQTQGTAVEIEGNIDIPEGNIYMENGSLVGSVRKTIYNINSNTDLDKGKYESGMILICDNSSDINLKLPSTNANHGDFFTMLKTGTGKVNVYGESYIPCRGGWKEGNGWTCSTRYEHVHFLFDGSTWYSECTLDS